mgnify:CR=1 FL=1
MSLLNNEATKEVLLEQDILSTSGRIQSIWDTFTVNVNPYNEDNDLLQLIISSLRTKFINNLSYGYADSVDLEKLIGQFQDLVDDVCKNTDRNVLSVFLLALANALSKSISTKNQSSANIEINMTESCADISLPDTIKTVSLLERHGLLDSNQLQSLLDDRSLALTKACTELGQRLDTPMKKDSGEDIPPLGLKDFILNFDEIMDDVKFLCNDGIDRFPSSISELGDFLTKSNELDETKLYHPKTYQSNVANSLIINATNNYLIDCFGMDTSTAMYALSSIDSKLKEIIDQVGQVSCLVYSQIIVKAILLKLIKEENVDLVSARDVLSEDYLKYTHVVKRLESQLKSLIDELDNSSVFVKTNLFRKDQMDEYVNFVRNSHSWDAEDLAEPFNTVEKMYKKVHKDFHLDDGAMNVALDELISGLDDITSEIGKFYIGERADWDEDYVGISEALSSSLMESSEQATESQYQQNVNSRLCSLVVESGASIHSELNHSLLDGDLENAANSIAREMALESFMQNITVKDKATMAELQSIKESIERDVSTYTGMLNHSVPGGISKYEESATSYIDDVMKTNNLT